VPILPLQVFKERRRSIERVASSSYPATVCYKDPAVSAVWGCLEDNIDLKRSVEGEEVLMR